MSLRFKARYVVLTAIAALLLILVGAVAWLLETTSGARAAVRIATGVLDGKLAVGGVEGRILGPLSLSGIRWRDPDGGVDAAIESFRLDARLSELLSRRAHVLVTAARGIRVVL